MGIAGSILHKGMAYLIQYLILWIGLVLFLGIPAEKMPFVLLLVLISGIIATIISSILLMTHR